MAISMSVNIQANYGIAAGNGGCYGPPQHGMGLWPSPCGQQNWNWNQGGQNLPNANVGQHGFLGMQTTNGYALDTNGDGRYTRGQDGVIGMDLNRDGRVSPQEIEGSQQRLQSMGGNFDLNHDGRTSVCERMKGSGYQREMNQYDSNHNGRLEANELSRAGGRVMVDSNRDGKFQQWEQHSPYNFPTGGYGQGRLNYVDPFCNTNSVNHQSNPWGPSPWGPCY